MEPLFSISEVAKAFGLSVPALRYYEERGLTGPAVRRGRVRYYDHAGLQRLAYAQLWHNDGLMPLADTAAVMDSEHVADRRALITEQRERMLARIARLTRAAAVLEHLLACPDDRPLDCPVTGAYIRARVDAALAGEEFTDDFLPSHAGKRQQQPVRPEAQ
ncbi:MerR family transcriptional regulator [Longispora fulva]|uniref:DNA-binding transcriptional MerR regulator n=1 Tax=Longispora fulva TaxID=619741 RepID=A0A8J7KUU7_9ACTN|nr:MerR family transcriptional regulator [Longispora fulva]MBG6134462.1 DNA-binding transcriptional MerR regulator [Longispora fulva]GIG62623.1 MerR family transcriptional regulator [Longispora fulva]